MSFSVVHVAIDVQDRFFDRMSAERRTSFPASIRFFADQLRTVQIPTIWVAYRCKDNETVGLHTDSGDGAKRRNERTKKSVKTKKLLTELRFESLTPLPDEPIAVKECSNAFDPENRAPALQQILSRWNAKTILVTGMNTQYCVKKTIGTALSQSFIPDLSCIAVFDLLADTGLMTARSDDENPLWHKKALETFERNKAFSSLKRDEVLSKFNVAKDAVCKTGVPLPTKRSFVRLLLSKLRLQAAA